MTLQAYDRGVLAVQRRAFEQAREQLELAGPDDRALLLLGQLAQQRPRRAGRSGAGARVVRACG
ncbi:hypothetical protein [Micromonospora sp. DT63]|uniref:hypothetical protein n=1 Tax=Micromonospora sp. DT63 TaxID=3393441 RepID=UPI003CE96114